MGFTIFPLWDLLGYAKVTGTIFQLEECFCQRKEEKVCQAAPLYLFWEVRKARNIIVLRDDVFICIENFCLHFSFGWRPSCQ